jgi:DNA adenine methylase
MRPTRPVLRYHGGKFVLRDWIVGLMPEHEIYTECYGGAASVLLAKPRSFGEVYNDLDGAVVRLFRVLRDPAQAERLREMLRLTPFAREEYLAARDSDFEAERDDGEVARRLIVQSFMGHSTKAVGARNGFRAAGWASNCPPPRDWTGLPDALAAVTARLQGVVIENLPALDVIRRHDGPGTLHYVDPPYLHETRARGRGYRFEMSRREHIALARELRSCRGAVMVSGYPHPLYERLYRGWHRVERDAHADGAGDRVEVVWSNRPLRQQLSLEGL